MFANKKRSGLVLEKIAGKFMILIKNRISKRNVDARSKAEAGHCRTLSESSNHFNYSMKCKYSACFVSVAVRWNEMCSKLLYFVLMAW